VQGTTINWRTRILGRTYFYRFGSSFQNKLLTSYISLPIGVRANVTEHDNMLGKYYTTRSPAKSLISRTSTCLSAPSSSSFFLLNDSLSFGLSPSSSPSSSSSCQDLSFQLNCLVSILGSRAKFFSCWPRQIFIISFKQTSKFICVDDPKLSPCILIFFFFCRRFERDQLCIYDDAFMSLNLLLFLFPSF